MKTLLLTLALTGMAGVCAWAGPVVIDGTDANDHGSATNNVNVEGWAYMQSVLENIATQLDPGVAKVVVDVGTTDVGFPDFGARAAINSAFNLSVLPSRGWTLVHMDGSAAIDSWLSALSTANTGILYIPTADETSGDLDADELNTINSHAVDIANYIGGNGLPLKGGGLFSMGESPFFAGTTAYGWLIELLPDITVTDVGGGGIGTAITLTAEGEQAFPELTSADLSSGPWHNYFSGEIGGLEVLGTAPDDNGVTRNIILGGGVGTSFFSLHGECITRPAKFWFSHPYNVNTTNCASLLNALRASGGGMQLGFIKLPVGYKNGDNVKDANDSLIEALGLYYRSKRYTGEITGNQSEELLGSRTCRARKKLSVELIAAIANTRFLGTNPTNCNGTTYVYPSNLIKQAQLVAASDDITAMRDMTSNLKRFNATGQTNQFFGGLVECSSSSAKSLRPVSRDPTTQSSCPGLAYKCDFAEGVSAVPYTRNINLEEYADGFPNPFCANGGKNVIWKIEPPVAAPERKFSADTSGSNFDTLVSVWRGTCGNLFPVGCNTGGTNGADAAQLSFRTDGTNTYYIVAEGVEGRIGNLKIRISSP
jgi:hypothetical protein